jgi:hypothetical protein
LRWSASEREVRAKFPTVREDNLCYRPAITEFMRRSDVACTGLVVEPYEVSGVPFALAFSFKASSRTLASARLSYEGPGAGTNAQDRRKSFEVRFRSLAALLSERYGSTSPKVEAGNGMELVLAMFRSRDTEIQLLGVLHLAGGERAERIEITYRQLGSGEAAKL